MVPNYTRTAATPSGASCRFGWDVSFLLLSRGPILIGAVISSLLFPFVAECFSTKMFVLLGIAMVGFVFFCHDLWMFATREFRFGVNRILDSIVLDDLLRAIYDPETGLVACLVATFVGASSMYALRMNPYQRTRLVQVSLDINGEEQAHTVLMEPGGCKFLLPEMVQDWLFSGETHESHGEFQTDEQKPSRSSRQESCRQLDMTTACSKNFSLDHGSEISTSDCDITDIPEQEEDDFFLQPPTAETNLRKISSGRSFGDDEYLCRDTDRHPEPVQNQTKLPQPMASESDCMTEFLTILKDLALERLRPHVAAMPMAAIENLGIASIVALAIQLLLGRKLKSTRLLGVMSALLFSSTATFSFGAIVFRQAILDEKTLQLACKDVAFRVWDKLKAEVRTKKAKSFVAMMILCIIGRRKCNTTNNLRTKSRP